VPDRYAAAAWYARILGLRIVPELEHWATGSGSPLMIATAEGATKLALFAGEPPRSRPTVGFLRVAFRVNRESFDAFLAHVRENPVFDEQGEQTRELEVHDYGEARSVYFCDPFGHRLEVTTYDRILAPGS